MQAAAFEFPEPGGLSRITLFVKVPGSGVAYFVDDAQTTYQTHFTILARVVDDKGEVIRKGSQPYRFSGEPRTSTSRARATSCSTGSRRSSPGTTTSSTSCTTS
jgi:hypothetical protein